MKSAIFVAALLLLTAVALRSQPVRTLDRIGQTPGGAGYHVNWDAAGKKLIVGCGTSVHVYDMTDPRDPVPVSKRPLLGLVNETDLRDDVLFVAATHDGVYALDYRSKNLDILAHYDMKEMGDSAAYDMCLSNDTLYIADYFMVRMLKYDTAGGFTHVGSFGGPRAFCVDRRGDRIAVGSHASSVSSGVISLYSTDDLSRPLADWPSSLMNLVQDLQFADASDDILYVCGGPENAFFTRSNLFALQFDGMDLVAVDTFTVSGGVPGIAQLNIINLDSRNDTLFVATTAAWDAATAPLTYVPVIDATGLPHEKMKEIARVTPGLWHFDVALMHGTPYAAMSSEWLGVLISDISKLAFMDTLKLIPTGGWCNGSKVKDNTLWVCHEGFGTVAYDIDSLKYSNGFWCDSKKAHIHDLNDHYFSRSIEFLNDTLMMLNTSKVYNIKPVRHGGSPELAYQMNKTGLRDMKIMQTGDGVRMVATYDNILSKWIEVFDPFDKENDYTPFFVETTNNTTSGLAVSGDTMYYARANGADRWLVAAKVAGDRVSILDSIKIRMTLGLLSFSDIRDIDVENGIVAVGYGPQFALFGWNGGRLAELFVDYQPYQRITGVVLRNAHLYTADKDFGVKIYDVSSLSVAVPVAQSGGSGGWMSTFGCNSIAVADDGVIYLSDFNAGIIIIEAFDDAPVSVDPAMPGGKTACEDQVYPNPFSSSAAIRTTGVIEDAELQIFNSIGQLIATQRNANSPAIRIDGSGLARGSYTYRIIGGSEPKTGRFIVY